MKQEKSPVLYWATMVTLVIIVLAFVVFPAVDGIFSPKVAKDVIGKYKGISVSSGPYSLYASNMSNMLNNVQQQYGEEQAQMYMNYFQHQVASETMFTIGIYNMLQEAGIQISTQKTNRLLTEQCGDWGLNTIFIIDPNQPIGSDNFNLQKYEEIKATNNSLVKGIRSNIALRGTVIDFRNNLTFLSTASKNEKEYYNNLAKETITGSYFAVTETMVDSSLLENFVNDNINDFSTLDLTVIRSENKKEIDSIKIEVLEDIEVFAERAKTYNSPALIQNTGLLSGFLSDVRTQLNITNEATCTTLGALKANEISDVISIDGYFYIFKANSDLQEADSSLLVANSRDKVVSAINAEDTTIMKNFISETATQLAESAKTTGFDTVALANNAVTEKMEEFPLNYGNANLIPSLNPTQFATNENFLIEAFSAKEGDVLNPVIDESSIYIYQVTSKTSESTKNSNGTEDQMPSALISQYILDDSRAVIYPVQSAN